MRTREARVGRGIVGAYRCTTGLWDSEFPMDWWLVRVFI